MNDVVVGQMVTNPDGSITGRNDCFEACLAAWLRTHRYPQLPAEDEILLAEVSLMARGIPDAEGNAETTLPEAEAAFRHYGVAYRWTDSYEDALIAPEAICLVDGTLLSPSQYPGSWFGSGGGQANHFIFWLDSRAHGGQPDWFMDPLAGKIVEYSLGSVKSAWYGAYLLSVPAHAVKGACALKVQPNHNCVALAQLAAGAAVEPTGNSATGINGPQGAEDWEQVRAAGKTGWLPMGIVTVRA